MTDQPTIMYRLQKALKLPVNAIRIDAQHRLIMEALLEVLDNQRNMQRNLGLHWKQRD